MSQQSQNSTTVSTSKLDSHLVNERNLSSDNLRFICAWLLTRVFLAPVLFFYTRVINRTRFYGLENLKKLHNRSYIVCTNHTSSFDIWMGFEIGFAGLSHYFSNKYYLCGLGAVDRLGPWIIRKFCIHSGVLPVDRSQGLDQYALQDVVRLLNEEKRKIACLIYPEGTRSKSGFLSREYKAGAGWVQSMTGVPVLPVYQIGYDQLPGVGKTLEIHIGEPMEFNDFQGKEASPSTWIKVTDQVMAELFRREQELHPRKEDLDKHLQNLIESKKISSPSGDFSKKKSFNSFPTGNNKVCDELRISNALITACKNPQIETVEWAESVYDSGSLGLISQWPNTSRPWIEKLVEQLNSRKVPYGLRLFHHPLTGASESNLLSKIDTNLCRLVLLEGYITPPDFISDVKVPLASALVSHEQARVWASTRCKFFIIKGDQPGAKLHRSSSQMIELIDNQSEITGFWGASDILTPYDAEDCFRRGADFLLIDGFNEWVSSNAWSSSLRSKLKITKESQVQLLPDPEYFDLGGQMAGLILDQEKAFRIRKLGDCSGVNVERQIFELLEIDGLEINDLIFSLTHGSSRHFSNHFSNLNRSEWSRKDWQLILRAHNIETQSKPAYVRVDPTVARLFRWFGDVHNSNLDISSVIQKFLDINGRR